MKISAHEVEFKLGLAKGVDFGTNLMAFQMEQTEKTQAGLGG